MKRTNTFVWLALVAASLGIGYQVYAHCGKCAADGKKIASQLDQSKFTLAKAVTAAEDHSKGRAISAISQLNDKGELTLNVFCMTGDKIVRCNVDSKSGSVKDMKDVEEFPVAKHEHAPASGQGGGAGGGGAGGGQANKMVTNADLEVGCGLCMYKMSGVEGCHLAVLLDGKPYLVEGANWPNHDFCDRKIPAVVTGRLQGDKFIATSMTEKK